MNLEDWKTLNLKDIGGWPVLPKIAALLFLLVAVVLSLLPADERQRLRQEMTRRLESEIALARELYGRYAGRR